MPCNPVQDGVTGSPEGALRFHCVLSAESMQVRRSLRDLMVSQVMVGLSDDALGTAEIVLAEALNNVVEHAYADAGGTIELAVARHGAVLGCCITDFGRPMPGVRLPVLPPALPEGLPEGGFGWYLIRVLAQDIQYRRIGQRNELSLSLAVAAKDA